MKKFWLIILLIFGFILNVNAQSIDSSDVLPSTYVIGKYMFTRNGGANYEGILTTQRIMLASRSIESNDLDDMIIYYKKADGSWIDGLTGDSVNAPNTFNIEVINLEGEVSVEVTSGLSKLSDDVPSLSYVIGKYMFTREGGANYNGTLTTPIIMLASRSIESNNEDDMIIYYRKSNGDWINGITGDQITAPNQFLVSRINLEVQEFNDITMSISGGDALKSTNQTLTLKCSTDNGLKAYYFGTTEPTVANDVVTTTSSDLVALKGTGLNKVINNDGTYWLACKDEDNNFVKEKIELKNYIVQVVVEKISGTTDSYTSSNYELDSSPATYLIKKGTSLILSTIYQEVPTLTFKGYSLGEFGTSVASVLTTNPIVTEDNSIYYLWFNRNTYNVTANNPSNGKITIETVEKGNSVTTENSSAVLTVKVGDRVKGTAIADLGYSFSNWSGYLNGNDNPTTGEIVASSETISGTFTANTYTVTFASNSECSLNASDYADKVATYNTNFTVNNPTCDGYAFLGWDITGMDNITHTYGSSTSTATSLSGIKATSFRNLRSTSGTVTFTAVWASSNYQNVNTNKIYATLNEAFNAISSSQTIKVLKNTTEVENISNSKASVKLDLNGKTVTLNGVGIANSGSLDIYSSVDNGELVGTGTYLITNSGTLTTNRTNTAEITIRNTSDSSSYGIYNSGGTFEINNGTILSTNGDAIYDASAGTINIIGGSIISNSRNGINMNAGGTLTLGNKNNALDSENPTVKSNATSSYYGIYFKTEESKFNFYDGKVIGRKNGATNISDNKITILESIVIEKITSESTETMKLHGIAILSSGGTFNSQLKKLSGQSDATFGTENTTITSITKVTSLPSGMSIDSFTSDNIISTNKSAVPIYAWYDNGTIYYYSEETKIYLNKDSKNMFYKMKNLTSIDLNNFNTELVTDMSSMFNGCSSLTSLNLSSFDTTHVTSMSSMFDDCSSLTSLDLSNFNTTSVTSMSHMFRNCNSLTSLNLSGFDIKGITSSYSVFSGTNSLKTLKTPNSITADVVLSLPYEMYDSNGVLYTELTDTTPTVTILTSITKLKDGQSLNSQLKKLANPSVTSYSAEDTKITSITRVTTLPSGMSIDSFTSNNIISASKSIMPIYAWYDDGTIYYYSEETKIYLDKNSSYMFYKMKNLTSVDLSSFNTTSVTNMSYMFDDCSSLTSLNLSSFNTTSVTNMSYMFDGCSSLTSLNLSSFNTTSVTNMSYMFGDCSSLTSLNLSSFNTTSVTNMSYMFDGCSSLTNLNLSSFNTTHVTNMSGMFDGCSSLTSLNLSSFNTTSVTSMSNMFRDCSSLTSLDLSNFNTTSVTNMSYMFYGCSSLTNLNLSSFNTTTVTSMSGMFYGCSSLTNLNLSSFNTTTVTSMSNMFRDCSSLTNLDLSNFNTASVTSISAMFSGCSSLTSLDLSNFDISQATDASGMLSDINLIQTIVTPKAYPADSNIYLPCIMSDLSGNMYGSITSEIPPQTTLTAHPTFLSGSRFVRKIKNLADPSITSYSADNTTITQIKRVTTLPSGKSIDDFTIDNVISVGGTPIYAWYDNGKIYYYSAATTLYLNRNSSQMFVNLKGLTSIDFTDVSSEATQNMWEMFRNCSSLTSLNLSNFDTSNVTNMASMFSYCSSLTSLNLSNFNTSKVTNMGSMFNNCSSLTSLTLGNNFNTSKVTNMSSMFSQCSNLSSLDLSNFVTSSVENMSTMFYHFGYDKAVTLNLSNWDTSKVTNMSSMFSQAGGNYNSKSFELIGLSSWNTSSVKNMGFMFYYVGNGTSNCKIGDLSEWKTQSVTDMNHMFDAACSNGTTWNLGDLSGWDVSKVENMSYMFKETFRSAKTNLDLSGWNVSKVENMKGMFNHLGSYATEVNLNLSGWETSQVKDMSYMFEGIGFNYATSCSVVGYSDFDTAKVEDMSSTFAGLCGKVSNLTIDLSRWDVSSVKNMKYMFSHAGDKSSKLTINLSGWDTSKVENMYGMFYRNNIAAAETNLDFGTLNVYADNINSMFLNGVKTHGTINIYSNPTDYGNAFKDSATYSGFEIVVNYSSEVTDIDNIIATKSSGSHVTKGSLLQ